MYTAELPNSRKTPVIGLVGYSYSGKSTAAEGAAKMLEDDGFGVTIIRKDDAIREAGRLKTGEVDTEHAYSVGSRDEATIRQLMNEWVKEELPSSDLLFLEGGVRTPSSAAAVLKGVESRTKLSIVTFDVSVPNIYRRFRQRRAESERSDDAWWLAMAKIGGQLLKNTTASDAPIEGAQYHTLDGNQPPVVTAASLYSWAHDELFRATQF